MREYMDIETENGSNFELGGFYMEPPTLEAVDHFMRPLSFEERLTLISGGFHRGPSTEHCYRYKEFVEIIAKREYKNPAGGVRKLPEDDVVSWVGDIVGDSVLAEAFHWAFTRSKSMAEAVDTIRIIAFVRLNQYHEVLEDAQATTGNADRYKEVSHA